MVNGFTRHPVLTCIPAYLCGSFWEVYSKASG
jgi:hypothetical protein